MIKERANERSPSPMSRIESREEKGIIGTVWCVCLCFFVGMPEDLGVLELGFDIPAGLGFPGPRPPLIFLEEDLRRLFLPMLVFCIYSCAIGRKGEECELRIEDSRGGKFISWRWKLLWRCGDEDILRPLGPLDIFTVRHSEFRWSKVSTFYKFLSMCADISNINASTLLGIVYAWTVSNGQCNTQLISYTKYSYWFIFTTFTYCPLIIATRYSDVFLNVISDCLFE